MEQIKEIEKFPGYFISPSGRVFTEIKPHLINRGYAQVSPRLKGEQKHVLIHRLVAESFIENPHGKSQVNHRNGVKTDNCVDNLEWMTPSENTKHGYQFRKRRTATAI